MSFIEKHGKLVRELYDISNPIIKYNIDKEWYRKEGISIEHYISFEEEPLNYWLNVYNLKKIHGRKDCTYENSIAKLLDFGLTRENNVFDKLYSYLLEDKHWHQDFSFDGILMKTVKYPFLIRAGYWNNKNVNSFFMNRLEKIEKTIKKYGYVFEGSRKYKDQFVFEFVNQLESLPTIYDLYAYAYYPKNDTNITNRIEKIIEYILDEKYQQIPKKAYIYDSNKKRYYAVGNVYHACMIEGRKLLYLYLLSHFKAIAIRGLMGFINLINH